MTDSVSLLLISTLGSLATVALSRIRCILRPCDPDGQKCQSGCSEFPLDKPEPHELSIQDFDIAPGRKCLIVASKD